MIAQTVIVVGPPALLEAMVVLLIHLPDTFVRVSHRDRAGRAERLLVTTSAERAEAFTSGFGPVLLIEPDTELPTPLPFEP